MDNEWLVPPQGLGTVKCNDVYAKLLEMMDQLEDERGYRFTEKQANAIQKHITALIDNIRAFKHSKKR